MLAYGAQDLARAYRTVRANTITIAEEIPESKYDFAPAPGTRTVRQLLVHVALSDSFSTVHKEKRTSFEGFNFPELVAQLRRRRRPFSTRSGRARSTARRDRHSRASRSTTAR